MRLTPNRFARSLPAALVLLALMVVPAAARRLDVEVWTDRGDDAVYEPGDAMRVKVRTTEDAYLLVYEIDSEGSVKLLFPWKRGSGRIEARSTLRLPDESSDLQLVVEEKTGQGFLVAVASDHPFRELPWYLRPFDPQAASVGYEDPADEAEAETEGIDEKGRIVGDPYVAMERIRRRVVGETGDSQSRTGARSTEHASDYSTGMASAYSTYYVHEQVRYPRYICSDCHRSNRWAWWEGFDPYYTRCSVVDFRVNWSWCWGPQLWTGYVPYYYYVVRSDCPPRYSQFAENRTRFSSWDGWNRFNDMSGGQLRRYKGQSPAPAPVGYTPPPPRGLSWRQGQTPPGIVPPEVRRQSGAPGDPRGWLQRDRGDGKPVFRDDPRGRPTVGGEPRPGGNNRPGEGERPRDWRQWKPRAESPPRGGNAPAPPEQGGQEGQNPPSGQGGERTPNSWRPRHDRPSPPSAQPDSPRQEQPRQAPPQQDPPRSDPGFRPPPASDAPKWSPPASKTNPPKGRSGHGKD